MPPPHCCSRTISPQPCTAAGRWTSACSAQARESWGEHGVVELTALCGYYTLVALILNVAEMPVPEGSRVPFEAARAEPPDWC